MDRYKRNAWLVKSKKSKRKESSSVNALEMTYINFKFYWGGSLSMNSTMIFS